MLRLNFRLVLVYLLSTYCRLVRSGLIPAPPSWGITGSSLSSAQFYTSFVLDIIAKESTELQFSHFPRELTPIVDQAALAKDLGLDVVFFVYREYMGVRLSDLDLPAKFREYRDMDIEIIAVILHSQDKELLAGFTAPAGTEVVQLQVRDVNKRVQLVESRLTSENRKKLQAVLQRHLSPLQPSPTSPTESPPPLFPPPPSQPTNQCVCSCPSVLVQWLAVLALWAGTIFWVDRRFLATSRMLSSLHVQSYQWHNASAKPPPLTRGAPFPDTSPPLSKEEPVVMHNVAPSPGIRAGLVKRPVVTKQSSWFW